MKNAIVPDFIFGQNLEHTRACVFGGLSAQLLVNRKFAGKPSGDGVAADWIASSGDVFFELLQNGYTHHAVRNGMFRQNEVNSQFIMNLSKEYAGIFQINCHLKGKSGYTLRIVARTENGEPTGLRLLVESFNQSYKKDFKIDGKDWRKLELKFKVKNESDFQVGILVEPGHSAVIGVASLLPDDHFHGMRRDVIERLKEIGTSVIRWPGGNFAGEYRWRDGLLDPDERAPLQSFMEIETQTYTHGYDNNEIGTDEVIALCREIGAQPFFTINPVWDSPEETAAWVEYCNGDKKTPMGKIRAERGFQKPYDVKLWSLGNEMGYGHMEGPHTPQDYVELARRHANAMLKVDSGLQLVSSGPYPQAEWTKGAAIPLEDVAQISSLHHYMQPGVMDMTSPERTKAVVQRVVGLAEGLFRLAENFSGQLPKSHRISFDEWNVWYSWFRETGTSGGMLALRVLHGFMKHWQDWRLSVVCFFQPINEGAIDVPIVEEAYLTAMGQAMSLAAHHKGNSVESLDDLPAESFASKQADGRLVVTIANTDMENSLKWTLPDNLSIVSKESVILKPESFLPRSLFESKAVRTKQSVTLPPFSMALIVLENNK